MLQLYQELGKEIRVLGKVTTLGPDRFIITFAKKDQEVIRPFKGETVVLSIRKALEE